MPATKVKDGARVARALGWPAGEFGLWGAFGGLISPASFKYHRPVSSLGLIQRYQRTSDRAVRHHLRATTERLLEQSRHASR